MATNDGGPAFPFEGGEGRAAPFPGMSLRDWFAGMAMQGILAGTEPETPWPSNANITSWSYDYADAMLKARGPVPPHTNAGESIQT